MALARAIVIVLVSQHKVKETIVTAQGAPQKSSMLYIYFPRRLLLRAATFSNFCNCYALDDSRSSEHKAQRENL